MLLNQLISGPGWAAAGEQQLAAADDFNYAWRDIDDLAADTSPDLSADYVMTYDATAGEHRRCC